MNLIHLGVALGGSLVALLAVRYVLERRLGGRPDQRLKIHLILSALTLIAIVVVVESAPLTETQKGQILSLLGILLSAAFALSSTTLFGNAMAGIMLRAVRSFRLGDFIQVGEHFGRVSERGLFHTEIQSELRDLISLPNLYLVSNPVRVVRSSGTVVSVDVSLGYDIPRQQIEKALLAAAQAAELTDPYVHIMDLGDFSITYRLAGLLSEVKSILSTRSRLREMMLDKLHEAGIEIVSPAFTNMRTFPEGRIFIPPAAETPVEEPVDIALAEKIAFDKAEHAETMESLQRQIEGLEEEVEDLKKEADDAGEGIARGKLRSQARLLASAREILVEEKHRRESAQKPKA